MCSSAPTFLCIRVCGCNLGRNTLPDEGATNSPEMVSGDSDEESQNKTESDDQEDELQRLQVLSMACTKSFIWISVEHKLDADGEFPLLTPSDCIADRLCAL